MKHLQLNLPRQLFDIVDDLGLIMGSQLLNENRLKSNGKSKFEQLND